MPPPPPSSGYYPGDLQSAYGLADAAAGFSPGPSAPTVAIVDAYDDPNAASDLAAYRASLSKATDQNTGIADAAMPVLCSSTVTTGCVTFTKVNQSGGKTYPPGNAGWAQEISLDLDMVSAICPNGVAVYDTYSETGWLVFGGTSVSTQIIGATYALAAGSGTLQAAPSALYVDSLSASATGPTTGIVPVTTGSNATCGDYLCDAADSLSSGYNGPAGLGTPYGVSPFVTSATTSTGFGLTVTPASATVTQGNVTSYTVTVSPSGGFDSSVSLAVSGVLSGASSTFTPSSATSPSWSSTLSVTTTTSTTAGTYTLVISGTSGSLTSQTDVTLTVQAAQTAASMQVTLSAGKATKKGPHYKVPLTVSASDASTNSPLDGASVVLQIFAGSTCSGTVAGSGTGTTGTNGQFAFSFSTGKTGEWCAAATVTDTGYNPGSAETTFNT